MTPVHDTAEEAEVEIHAVSLATAFVSDVTLKRLAEEIAKEHLRAVMQSMRSGTTRQGELKPFARELSVVKGVLLKDTKAIVPMVKLGEIL